MAGCYIAELKFPLDSIKIEIFLHIENNIEN